MASSQHDVYLLLQTCVRNVIPRDFIGGKRNHRLLYKLLRSLASSGRFGHMDRLRMHKLFMDCSLNSRETVLVNLYQNFLVCGKKMHATCQQLPASSKGDGALVKVVWDVISLGHMLLRTRRGDNAIPPADVTWLGLVAFHTVFQRKQARYTQLLSRLYSALSLPKLSQMARRHAAVVSSPDNAMALSIAY